ncbi:MAG: isopentenyl diphosphate isomerase/L-lactate dehydrogenase-like FMN-dependent dehydrogenase [Myxococcota bacterium]|jgi:isopentenyl diphosphate isomerase/L-lactate dehydrogenase-like FMN-dependent dehydrogenase
MNPLNLDELEQAAAERLSAMANDYYAGAARDGITLKGNRAAWDRLRLYYRVMVDVAQRDLSTTVLGQRLALPILAAPTAFHRLAHPDGELATARGCGVAGAGMVLSTLSTVAMEEVAAVATGPLWFQLYIYRDRAVTRSLVQRAEAAGYSALVLTVDAAIIGARETDARNRFHLPDSMTAANLVGTGMDVIPAGEGGSGLETYVRDLLTPKLTWADLDWLVAQTRLPVLVKGVIRADDAVRAVAHGASGVIVSNHGGRQLDGAPPTAEALPAVVEAVGGRVAVLVDGGIRRGSHVLRALAMGADAVLVGRPVLWGLAVDGADGVSGMLAMLAAELDEAMALCGCEDINRIPEDLVRA